MRYNNACQSFSRLCAQNSSFFGSCRAILPCAGGSPGLDPVQLVHA
jgi:hypothetical protein